MSWLDQSAIWSSIGAEGSATLCFFGPPVNFLGGSHRFYPLKERRKAKVRRPSGPPCLPVQDGGRGKPKMGLVAIRDVRMSHGSARTWGPRLWSTAFNVCSAAEPDLMQASQTREGIHSVIQHPARWAFSAAAAAQIMCILLPHLETTLPFSPAVHCQVATSLLHLSTQRKD